jgi:hypothetical protein
MCAPKGFPPSSRKSDFAMYSTRLHFPKPCNASAGSSRAAFASLRPSEFCACVCKISCKNCVQESGVRRGDYKNVGGRRGMPCRSVLINRPQPCLVHIPMLALSLLEANDGAGNMCVVIGARPSAPAPLFATLCCAPRDPRSASARCQGRPPSCEWALVRAFDSRCREVQSPNQGASAVPGRVAHQAPQSCRSACAENLRELCC